MTTQLPQPLPKRPRRPSEAGEINMMLVGGAILLANLLTPVLNNNVYSYLTGSATMFGLATKLDNEGRQKLREELSEKQSKAVDEVEQMLVESQKREQALTEWKTGAEQALLEARSKLIEYEKTAKSHFDAQSMFSQEVTKLDNRVKELTELNSNLSAKLQTLDDARLQNERLKAEVEFLTRNLETQAKTQNSLEQQVREFETLLSTHFSS